MPPIFIEGHSKCQVFIYPHQRDKIKTSKLANSLSCAYQNKPDFIKHYLNLIQLRGTAKMFKSGSKFMDDIARMAGGTVGILNSLKQELQDDIKERVDMMAERLDLVPRVDFEKLEARIATLEKQLGVTAPEKTSKAKKAAPKKKTDTKAKATPKAKTAKTGTAKKSAPVKKAPAKKTATNKTPAKKTAPKKKK